jgi:hypothetical protein
MRLRSWMSWRRGSVALTKYERPDVVWIRWVDSCNLFRDRWAAWEDLDLHEEETFCETVAFLVAETDHSLFLAGSMSEAEIGSVMQIPKVCVRERRSVLKGDM